MFYPSPYTLDPACFKHLHPTQQHNFGPTRFHYKLESDSIENIFVTIKITSSGLGNSHALGHPGVSPSGAQGKLATSTSSVERR